MPFIIGHSFIFLEVKRVLFLEAKRRVLQIIREYSNAGKIIEPSRNRDYLLSMPDLFNQVMEEMATQNLAITKSFDITMNNPTNMLGLIEWNESSVHDDADITFLGIGAKAYSFQVSGTATVYIEEEINGAWTEKLKIDHVSNSGDGYVTYNGLIQSDASNMVRIRFSGDYYYAFRWVALFSQNFSIAPKFEPYVPIEMPSDYFRLKTVTSTYPDRQYTDYSAYKIEKNGDKNVVYINWYEKGEIRVHYYAYPEKLTTDNTNLNINDNVELSLPIEWVNALVYKVASMLQIDENTYISSRADEYWRIAANGIEDKESKDTGSHTVQSVTGW